MLQSHAWYHWDIKTDRLQVPASTYIINTQPCATYTASQYWLGLIRQVRYPSIIVPEPQYGGGSPRNNHDVGLLWRFV